MHELKPLRIAINAQLRPGSGAGGVESVLRVLAGLSQLEGPEHYLFVVLRDHADWLRPFLHGTNASIVMARPSLRRRLLRIGRHAPIPMSPGFFDRLSCDVVHFPYQVVHRTSAPMIFNPHDLQHVHYPQFFSAEELRYRETVYPAACRRAHTVAVASHFVKRDLIEHYQLDPAKIRVLPWAPLPLDVPALQSTRQTFALYPAMLWEHKNHLRLLDAVALLRDERGLHIDLICTGHKTDYWPVLENRIAALELQDQITFPGVVSGDDLTALYRSAQFVIIPSLFEAASAPMFEAWQHGAPVACAAITALPEQAGDAALLFDPTSVHEIATALERMSTDAQFRNELRANGTRRLSELDPIETLKRYRAVYREAAGQALDDEDRWLLSGT
ncbi:MAG TPA: glycosyltransferase family 1 protein [Thermoanaerobaculia bacterium]|nr:glycosyltransferase family 1 protein [Thermoanaerobaculia bacterium]